jgi:enamine deaminase RidA (YjgF/YER057c/UK114 family)
MRKTVSAPEFAHFHDEWHLSPGLDADDFIFFSGVTGCHPDDAVAADPDTQFRDAFQFLDKVL